MIFLTVGTQLPFDRLVETVDRWSAQNPEVAIFGQIADAGAKGFLPTSFEWEAFVEPDEFTRRFDEASVIIAHAGMGSIISALTHAKPIIIMPRYADLGEHRNDHQIATAEQFKARAGVSVVTDYHEFDDALAKLIGGNKISEPSTVIEFAEDRLVRTLRDFIQG